MTPTAAKDPTCTAPGNSAYWYCTVCEKYFSDEAGATEIEPDSWVISANGHHYGTPTWTWAEDYSKATATFTCEKNDDTQNVIDNEPTTATISEQSCTTAHVVKYTATVTFKDEPYSNTTAEITLANALGHTWGTPTYTWAEDNTSVTATRVCGRNDEHKETATVAATYSVVTAAQCGVAGLGRWTSAAFENTAFEAQTKDVTIPALKHDLTFHAATATCQHAGQRSYYECQRCGKLYWDQYGTSEITDPAALNVDKVDHDFNDPGCKIRNNNDRETHSYLCIHECGNYGRREAHVFDQKVIAPDYLRSKASCTEPAIYYMSCACGEKGSTTFTVGEKLGHHIVPVAAVAATCTKSGNNAYYKCDQCNATFSDELGETPKSEAEFSVAALGHKPYALDTAKSGCTEDGSLKWDAYSCSRCGDYYMRLTVTAFNGDGNKLSNVTVKITDNSGRVNITGKTDETGSFTPNESFRPGTYNFTLSGNLNGVNINHKATVALTAGTVSGTIGAVNAPSTPSTPSDPGSGSGSGSSGSNVCGYCGKVHTGPFGWLIQLIHNILRFFRR
jgi:transposase-like protein